MNEYLLARISDIAETLTWPELLARIAEREPYRGPCVAELIREDRDSR